MRRPSTVVLLLAVVLLFALPLVLDAKRSGPSDDRFAGTDALATERIQQDHPDYRPWASPLFVPRPGSVESGLFALQAALGAGGFGYAIGVLRTRRKLAAAPSDQTGD